MNEQSIIVMENERPKHQEATGNALGWVIEKVRYVFVFVISFIFLISLEIVKKVFGGIATMALGAIIIFIQLVVGAQILIWLFNVLTHHHG